jgi:transformation/transcription domain-associated protein
VLNFDDSKPLRQFLGGRQGSVSLLNVCFERPLAIIHSEKSSGGVSGAGVSPIRSTNSEEVLLLHGIQPHAGPQHQREAVLLREVEAKQRKLKVLQQEIVKWKDTISKGGQASGSGATPEAKVALDEAKKQLRISRAACDKASKELADVRKLYADEVAKKKAAAQPSPTSQESKPMGVDSLELQHQGFRLVESLLKDDPSYLREHTDVLRAFRWLWRSKGRYLRMQFEEHISPRYHGESKVLSLFLISYSKAAPNDVDVLFELIRIFLQPSTCDFSFVRRFFKETASACLDNARKGDIMRRFFALMAGESTEEIKTLSLSLVVYPMLQFSFEEKGTLIDSPGRSDVSATEERTAFVKASTTRKFVEEVLYDHGKVKEYSDRLKVGLLQVSDIFLRFVPEYFNDMADELVKYCWFLTKTEASSCKNWAYFVLCRCIAMLETPQCVIIQVYNSLLRSHQVEGKDRIQAALDLLVPTFTSNLDSAGMKAVVDTTNTIMFEEANSIAQLAHVFHVVVHQPDIFFQKRALLASYMVNSLNCLGLPPNNQPEYRILAVSIVDLVIHWEDNRGKRVEDEKLLRNSPSKNTEEQELTLQTTFTDDHISFDESVIETILNFLVRLKILLADPKIDTATVDIQPVLDSLLQEVVGRWRGATVCPAYFEKVVTMCIDDEERSVPHGAKDDIKTGKGSKPYGKAARDDSGKKTTSGLVEIILACIQIFQFLLVADPSNSFLLKNPNEVIAILGACFRHARQPGETKIQGQLLNFLVPYFSVLRLDVPTIDERVVQSIRVWLEMMLVDAEVEFRKAPTPSVDASRQTRVRSQSTQNSENARPENLSVLFALNVIKTSSIDSPSFSKFFVSSLLNLLNTIVKKHTLQVAAKQKQNGVSYNSQTGTISIRQAYSTPTYGVMEEARLAAIEFLVGIPRNSHLMDLMPLKKDRDEFDGMLQSASLILDILGDSDIVYSFSGPRKSLLSLLQSILETSNSLQLLLHTVRVVGEWLIAGYSGPLTVKERVQFISKIASFDFNGLSDVTSQPLLEVVSQLVNKVISLPRAEIPWEGLEKEGKVLNQSIAACLLAARTVTRDEMLELFCRPMLSGCHDSVQDDVLHLFFGSDLETMGGRFWPALLVELLLSKLDLSLESSSESIPSLGGSQRNKPEESDRVSHAPYFHDKSVYATGQEGARRLMSAFRCLTHGDPQICKNLLECLLPAAWRSVGDNALQQSLVNATQNFLSRPFHTQLFKNDNFCLLAPQNAVKSFLGAVNGLDPVPLLETDLLLFLARTYNCWYEALALLQKQFLILSDSDLSPVGNCTCDKLLLGMRHCYRELGESDIWTTLALKSCVVPGSAYAATLEIYGRVDKATEAFSCLIDLVESGEINQVSDFEMDFWEERWVGLQQQLQQIAVVSEYAKQSKNERLMLECAWRERDWDKVRSLCSSQPIVAAVERGDPAMKICETLSAVADGKLGDVENLHAQASQLALYRWQFLPRLSSGSGAHALLLHQFHRLVEIRESGQIMVETNKHSNGKTLPDLKNLLK